MNKMLIFILAGFATATAIAQQVASVTPFVKPLDTIRLLVEFNGPDVSEIAWIRVRLALPSQQKDNQKGFTAAIDGDGQLNANTGNWSAEIKVPALVAEGQYQLEYVWVRFKSPTRPEIVYGRGDLPDVKVQIKNQLHYENPKVKSVSILP
jgi:hypothetical protein